MPALRTLKDEVSKHLRANIDHAMTFSIRYNYATRITLNYHK